MHKRTRSWLSALLCLLLLPALALAQSGGPYDGSWSTVNGGGATFSGYNVTIAGSYNGCLLAALASTSARAPCSQAMW